MPRKKTARGLIVLQGVKAGGGSDYFEGAENARPENDEQTFSAMMPEQSLNYSLACLASLQWSL